MAGKVLAGVCVCLYEFVRVCMCGYVCMCVSV